MLWQESVGGEIQAYLRERPDTVRCIVTSLTGHSGSLSGDVIYLNSSIDLYQDLSFYCIDL